MTHLLSSRLGLAVLPTIILIASCTGSANTEGPFVGEEWTVQGPTLRIGSVEDPDYAFQAVQALAMSPSGILHSLHYAEATIRRWDAEGRPAGGIGRQGEGPGEFTTPGGLGFFGDSLWVMDRRAYRISYFDLDGEFIGSLSPTVDMTPDPDQPDVSAPRPARPLRDGTLYGIAPAWSDAIARGRLTQAKHTHLDPEGGTLGTVWIQPYRSTDVLALLRETGGMFSSQPFGDKPLFDNTIDDGLLVLDRRPPQSAGRSTVHLTKIAITGDTLFSRELEFSPEALPRARIDSAAHAQAETMLPFMQRGDPEMSLAKLEGNLREAMYGPEILPAFSDLIAADDGSIWLQRFSPTEVGIEWWVLDSNGESLARAITPKGVRVLLITADAVWGVESDEFDVNYIVRFDRSQ